MDSVPYEPPPLSRSLRFWVPTFVCFLVGLALPAAFFLGPMSAELQRYERRAESDRAEIEPVLRAEPEAFAGIKIERTSNGIVYLLGTVRTQADHDRLTEKLMHLFGDEEAGQMASGVTVR